MNIVILDGYACYAGDLNWDALEKLGTVTAYPRTADTEKVERARYADAVLINKVKMDAETLDRLPRLKYIGVQATGFNAVDIQAAKERGITVTNVPAYSTDSVAQATFAHILAVANRVEHYAMGSREGTWSAKPDFCYWDTPLMEISGKNFGIMGLGNIGKKVASIALAFGMNVYACTSKAQDELPEGIKKVEKDELLAVSDVLSLHCPLTGGTHHFINAETLKKMKKTAILVNTGRGALVDEEAVARALHEGTLGAYCADVMTQEPPSADNPLLMEPNAYITPHVAWCTIEARTRLNKVISENLKAFIEGHPQNVVNP